MTNYFASPNALVAALKTWLTSQAKQQLPRLRAGQADTKQLRKARLGFQALRQLSYLLQDPAPEEVEDVETAIEETVSWILKTFDLELTSTTPYNLWAAPGGTPGTGVHWADILDVPDTFPPSDHTHISTQITDFAAAVLAIIGEQELGVSDHEELTGILGDAGHYHVSQALYQNQAALLALLFVQPTLSLSVSPSGRQERGAEVDITLTATTTNGSASAPTFSWTAPATGTASSSAVADRTDTATYTVQASFPNAGGSPNPIIKTATVTLSFDPPYYYGADSPGQTGQSFILGLTKGTGQRSASRDLLFTQSVGETRYYAQAKADNGYLAAGLTSILNNLGYETLSGWTHTEVSVDLGAVTLTYYLYEYNTPTALAVSNLKNTFKQ